MTISNQSAVLGFTDDRATPAAEFPLGTVVVAGNTSFTYAQAALAQAAAATTALTAGFATTAGATHTHNVVAPGVPVSNYFWAKRVTTAL